MSYFAGREILPLRVKTYIYAISLLTNSEYCDNIRRVKGYDEEGTVPLSLRERAVGESSCDSYRVCSFRAEEKKVSDGHD